MRCAMLTRTVVLLTAFVQCSCGYAVLRSRTEVQDRNPTFLEEEIGYSVEGMSLLGGTLQLTLDRSCFATREVDRDTLLLETREYETQGLWIAGASVASIGLMVAMILYLDGQFEVDTNRDPICFSDEPDCEAADDAARDGEDLQATAGTVALGSLLVGGLFVAIAAIYDSEIYESETLLTHETVRLSREPVGCNGLWPQGTGTVLASSVGRNLSAHGDGAGRVEVDVSSAPMQFWTEDALLRLELPGYEERIEFQLSDEVRTMALQRAGGEPLALTLTFDDVEGDRDGRLDLGEIAHVMYEVTNHTDSPVTGVILELEVDQGTAIEIENRMLLADLQPGMSTRGQLAVSTTSEARIESSIIEGSVSSREGVSGGDRLQLVLDVDTGPTRAYVWYEPDSESENLLAMGSVRIQTVLTERGQFAFVADATTRDRIDRIVESGGGSVSERLLNALEAANQENINRVFQLSTNPVAGSHIQIVLSVFETGSSDRIFLRDAMVDSNDAMQVLEVFDQLGRSFAEWEEAN